jgi:Flp pilus assembly protein TadG
MRIEMRAMLIGGALKLARCRAGAAAVEMALIGPVLALVLLGMIDFGMAIYYNMQVQSAAQAGAQYAIQHAASAFNASAVQSAVTKATTLSGLTAGTPATFCGCATGNTIAQCVSGSCASGTLGTYVTVTAQATYNTILPYSSVGLNIPKTYTLTGTTTVRLQ